MKGKPNVKKKLKWNLALLMADNKIRSAAELRRRLTALGIEMTSIHLSRMMYERPVRLNTDLLDAFIEIFDCSIGDLLTLEDVTEEAPPAAKVTKLSNRKKVQKKSTAPMNGDFLDELAGPDAPAFPPIPDMDSEE